MIKSMCLTVGFLAAFVVQSHVWGDEPVFSGPQVGETLPQFAAKSVLGKTAGEEVDLIAQADGKPVLLVFVNGRTRPGFGLTNAIMKYAGTRAKDGLQSGVIILTDDATAATQWMRVVQEHFSPDQVVYGIAKEGQEGPGAYGLNRNVELTILVGTEGKVAANFALVQPSMEADGPKILKAIVDVLGGGEVPSIADLGGMRYQGTGRARMRANRGKRGEGKAGENDPQLTTLMRSVINRQATPEDVQAAVAKIDEYVAKNDPARQQLGRIASTIVKSGKVDTYGTEPAQDAIRKWAEKYGEPKAEKKDDAEPKE